MSMPNIGQALRVRMTETDGTYYTSRLIESSVDYLYIDIPLHSTEHTAAPLMVDLWVEYHATDGALCRFPARLLSAERLPVRAWKVTRPRVSDITRDQRREFVRVQADIPVRLEYLSEGGKQMTEVHTRDISGGGMSVALPRNVVLRTGSVVETKFTLPNGGFPVGVKCLVVRVGDRNEYGLAACSMQFLDMKEAVRQRVIQYTFWRQRHLNLNK